MSFWSSETMKNRIEQEGLIFPYTEDSVRHCAYELRLGDEYFATGNGKDVKQKIDVNEQITILPGQFALLLTEEKVKIPDDALGMISIKAGIKFKGLVNVSGFHADPGFHGKILFSVYNAGSQKIALTRSNPYFLLWFCDLDSKTGDLYSSSKNGQGISDEHVFSIQGSVASPAELNSRLQVVEGKLKTVSKLAWGLGLGVVIAMFKNKIAAFF